MRFFILVTFVIFTSSCSMYHAAFKKDLYERDSHDEYVFDFARKISGCLKGNNLRAGADLQFELVMKYTQDRATIEKVELNSKEIRPELVLSCKSVGVKYIEKSFERSNRTIHSRNGDTTYHVKGTILPDFKWETINDRTNDKWNYGN